MPVFAFISASGGCGRTAIACGVSAAFARNAKTLLLDMCAGSRMADMYIGLDSRIAFDLSDAFSGGRSFAIIKHGDLDTLSFIAAPYEAMDINSDEFYGLAEALRAEYEWIILDCPTGFSNNTQAALRVCDKSFIIVTPENAAVRAAERMAADMLAAGLERPDAIVNRAIPEYMAQGVQLSPDAVAQALDLRVISVVRENDGIYRACAKGAMAFLKEDSSEYAAMLSLSERMGSGGAPKGYKIKKRFMSSQVNIHEVPA